jgi:virginiamycin B lyase
MKFSKQIFLTCTLLFIFSSSCFALEPAVFEAITPLPSQVSEGEPVYVEYRLKNPNYTPISVIVLLNQLPGVYIRTIGCSIGSTYPARISDYDYCILGFTFTAPFLSSGAYSKVWATAQTSGFDPVSLTVSTQIIPTLTVIPIVEPKGCKACTGTTSPGAVFVYNGNSTSFSLNPNVGTVFSSVNSSCGGTLAGLTYTTNPITKDCNVYVAFIQEYSMGLTAHSGPYGIDRGDDGNLWFTELLGNRIGRINPTTGSITEYPIPTADSEPNGIYRAPSDYIWFTEFKGNKIGKIDIHSGVITEYPIPTENSQPFGIAGGPDGNVWFTEQAGNKIGVMSRNGTMIAEYAIPTANSEPSGITIGSDMWFTEFKGNKIGKITTEGVITEYPIPTEKSRPVAITEGWNNNEFWFTESTGNNIGKITSSGVITEYPIPTKGMGSYGITRGPLSDSDALMWFTESNGNNIGKITKNGVITEYPTPAGEHDLYGITWGSDGNLWFTEAMGNKIGVL